MLDNITKGYNNVKSFTIDFISDNEYKMSMSSNLHNKSEVFHSLTELPGKLNNVSNGELGVNSVYIDNNFLPGTNYIVLEGLHKNNNDRCILMLRDINDFHPNLFINFSGNEVPNVIGNNVNALRITSGIVPYKMVYYYPCLRAFVSGGRVGTFVMGSNCYIGFSSENNTEIIDDVALKNITEVMLEHIINKAIDNSIKEMGDNTILNNTEIKNIVKSKIKDIIKTTVNNNTKVFETNDTHVNFVMDNEFKNI